MAKNNNLIWLGVIVLAVILLGGGFKLSGNFTIPNFFGNTGTGLVNVNKCIDFALTDMYGGSALASKALKVYDSDGETLLESLTTTSDGTIATAFTYPSGKLIYVYYESSNDKQWWQLTVPQMNSADSESATVNSIALKSFAIGTYSSGTLTFGATAITDGQSYNFTASGETQTFTYRIPNTGNDNTGFMDSYDPIYKMNYWVCFQVTFSGTGYQTVLPYGFSYDFTLGTTHYVESKLDAYALTKHKVGNIYKSQGVTEFTFSLDGTGYPDGGGTTMQLTVFAYHDPAYTQNHGGANGPEAVTLDEITVTLADPLA
jgi:hypothetical protein